MSAWTKLLTISRLSAGTAWQLLSNPKTADAGLTVYVDRLSAASTDDTYTGRTSDSVLRAELSDSKFSARVNVIDSSAILNDNAVVVETL